MGTVGLIAVHYPKEEYADEMIRRLAAASDPMRTVAGCREVSCWRDSSSGAIVAFGRWDSTEALQQSFGAVRAANVDFDYDEREARPREIFNLTELGP